MARKSYTTEQIIGLLRQAEVMLSQGKTLDSVIREIGVTDLTLDNQILKEVSTGKF